MFVILGLAIFGVYSLADRIIQKRNTSNPIETIVPSTGDKQPGDNNKNPVIENKDSTVFFIDQLLTIENPGNEFSYSVLTGENILNIHVNNRIPDKYGSIYEQKTPIIKNATINEEQNGYSITIDVSVPFTMEINERENEVTFKIVKQKNYSVLQYKNHMDRIHMHIDNSQLCSQIDSEDKNYIEVFDELSKTSTIRISNDNVPVLEDETLYLGDGYFEYINIKRTEKETFFLFKHMDHVIIYPNARSYESVFTFIKPVPGSGLIVIDPGHGGIDGGTTSMDESILEKNNVMSISKMLEEKLEQMGYKVYNLRQEDEYLGLMERTDIANLLKADIIVSVHINAYPADSSVNGALTMYKESYDLASSILRELVASTKCASMGVIKKEDQSILNRAEMDSVIVETGFLTNEAESIKLIDPDYHKLIADGIAKGIDAYIKASSN